MESQTSPEIESLAQQLGISQSELVELLATGKDLDVGTLAQSHTRQLHEILEKRSLLKKKIQMGARRTNGTFKFPV